MSYTYAIVGAGRQGVAAAYDLAIRGCAKRIILADNKLKTAKEGADRVNRLAGKQICDSVQLDVRDRKKVEKLLEDVDCFLSSVSYLYNLDLVPIAIKTKSNMCDLGGHTGIACKQHAFNTKAQNVGISIIPNCGQVPGMGTSLMVYAMQLLDKANEVYMWDGGIPRNPRPPFNYLLTFNMDGLTNEYAEAAVVLRDGKITELEPITELEIVEFPDPIGALEAFITGGGTDTMPWTFKGELHTLQNKTLRYPGTFASLRAFYDLGLWDTTPIQIGGTEVVPRDVFNKLFEPKVTFQDDKDIIILRINAIGEKDNKKAEALVEVIDYYDEKTGFTAMERTTGWSAAIVMEMMARGITLPGAQGVETLVPAVPYVEGLRLRGINVTEKITFI